jgi:hypothetical protein
MAHVKKRHGTAPPTPKANANGQAPPPPIIETTILADGTIERRQDGQLVSTTPPPAAKAPGHTPAAPKASAAPAGSKPGEACYVARLGTDDIWQFEPLSAKPGVAVMVTH